MFPNQALSRSLIVLMAGCLLLPLAGCQKKSNLPPLAVTTGTVTYEGKPLTSGLVTFVPDVSKGTTGPTGIGYIQSDGTYRIQTAQQDGALVGHHKIRVKSVDTTKFGEPWLIPIEYDSPTKSGLTTEIKAGQPNVVDLPLTPNP